jgi:hypothetical protein
MRSMTKKAISLGAVHNVPPDLGRVLVCHRVARAKWEDTYASRAQRVALGYLRQKTGNQKAAHKASMHGTKECAGLVAGQAVLTAENTWDGLKRFPTGPTVRFTDQQGTACRIDQPGLPGHNRSFAAKRQ